LFYVRKFFWPVGLCAIYPVFDELGWSPATAALWLLAFLAISALVVVLGRRWPVLVSGWLFYLITLSPTIGLVPVGIHVVAERFSYLPLLGLAVPVSLALAAAWTWAQDRISRRIAFTVILAGLVGVLVLRSAERTAVWGDTEKLFLATLEENPRCLPAHINLTVWYTAHHQYATAIAHGRQAVALAPQGLPGRKNLAMALINSGQHLEAVRVLRPATEFHPNNPDIWRALTECFEALGDTANATAARRQWQRLTPRPLSGPDR
jgi:tetratricopeptide (TPR) repeat protein